MADAVPDSVTGAPARSGLAPVVHRAATFTRPAQSQSRRWAPSPRTSWLASLSAAAVPWAVARFVVLSALVFARQLVHLLHLADPAVLGKAHQGLLSWDAGWYAGIASRGYGALSRDALRFFPLMPMVARGLHEILPLSTRACLVVVANACALVAGVLLHQLVVRESGDGALARRATWLMALAPPAYVLVMGYSEALAIALAIAAFLALRRRRWWWAAAWGVLAGLARPLMVLLVVPAVVEVARAARDRGLDSASVVRRARAGMGRLAAVASAPAGAAAYMAWVGARFGDALLPVRIQQQRRHRGRLELPTHVLARAVGDVAHGRHLGQALHLPWVALLCALVVVAARRWPPSFAAYAGAVLALSLCSANLDSLERYALGAFPFVLAGASSTESPRLEGAVMAVAAMAMGGYAVLAFLNLVVP
ncbi:MAG TPA: mannosyltransferase family protein [Acidimicrobiales bacterium]|nr:mannosyltransferase family protein [Acidimicrobiales bacterium]